MTQTYCFKIDKLIRDKLPEIMRKYDAKVFERVMEKDEYITKLKDKLFEEVQEVNEASSKKDICEELGDLLEVIKSVARINDIEFEDVLQAAEDKKVQKGGFEKRIYVDYVEVKEGHPMIEYYRKNKDKYPEIA